MSNHQNPRDDDALRNEHAADDRGEPGPHPREDCKSAENDEGDIVIYELGNGNRWIASSIASRTRHRR